MLNALNNILKRKADRQHARKKHMELCQEVTDIIDEDADKENNKKRGAARTEYVQSCAFIDYDMDVLLEAIKIECGRDDKKVEHLVGIAADKVPLDARQREKLKEAEARAKEAEERKQQEELKRTGDVPGQLKIDEKLKGKGKVKDDGSTAEPAGPVTTQKVDKDGNPVGEKVTQPLGTASGGSPAEVVKAPTAVEKAFKDAEAKAQPEAPKPTATATPAQSSGADTASGTVAKAPTTSPSPGKSAKADKPNLTAVK